MDRWVSRATRLAIYQVPRRRLRREGTGDNAAQARAEAQEAQAVSCARVFRNPASRFQDSRSIFVGWISPARLVQDGASRKRRCSAPFTLFAEEHGFLGSLGLLLIYIIIIYRVLRIGAISRSYFAKLFCYGYGSAIFFYVTVNMSMVLGLLPIVGSPLPIMSYGGSSMLATMIGFAIVMSAKINHKQLIA